MMSERKIVWKNFRNLGVNKEAELILDYDINSKKIGGLVTLIGPNNSGKSNVLRGIEKIAIGKLVEDDITDIDANLDDRDPEVKLVISTDDGDKHIVKIEFNKDGYKTSKITNGKTFYDDKDSFINIIIEIAKVYKNLWIKDYGEWGNTNNRFYGYNNNRVSKYYNLVEAILRNFPFDVLLKEDLDNQFQQFILELCTDSKYESFWSKKRRDNAIIKRIIREDLKSLSYFLDDFEDFHASFFKQYGINLVPDVFVCDDSNVIKDEDFVSKRDEKNDVVFSSFLIRVLTLIGYDVEEFKTKWEKIKNKKAYGHFKTIEKEANKKLKSIAKDFNKIYNNDVERYKFRLGIDEQSIYFYMGIDDNNVILSRQSEGFKWFFNFFFNFLLTKETRPGDIVIIDEVGSKLHYQGIKELYDFLKKYALEHNLTFVLATHSPAFVNNDFLEELRIVKISDNSSESNISNRFTMYEDNDPNVLRTIKYALTVEQHMIMNPQNKVIFVEGITDYNYLTAMKKLFLQEDNVYFLPIQGVAKSGEAIKKLKTIRQKPFFLVDGDQAGRKFKKDLQSENYSILTLSEIDEKFEVIEDLFSEEDKGKFGLKDKKYNKAYLFKKNFDENNLSEETITNFKKIFDKIAEIG